MKRKVFVSYMYYDSEERLHPDSRVVECHTIRNQEDISHLRELVFRTYTPSWQYGRAATSIIIISFQYLDEGGGENDV